MNVPKHERIEQENGELALIFYHEKHEAVVWCKRLRGSADDVVDHFSSYHAKDLNQVVV